MSAKRAKSTREMAKVRKALADRCMDYCECCAIRLPIGDDGLPLYQAHHRLQRSLGGKDTLDNLLACCPACHYDIHHEVAYSTAVGWLLHSWQRDRIAETPVYYQSRLAFLLGPEGTRIMAPSHCLAKFIKAERRVTTKNVREELL